MRRLLASLVLLLAVSSRAANYYAVVGGAGTQDGSSWENGHPDVQSLAQSLYPTSAGVTNQLWVGAGTWIMTNQMLPASNLWIRGTNRDATILSGNFTTRVVKVVGKNVVLDSLTIANGRPPDGDGGGGVLGNVAMAIGAPVAKYATVAGQTRLTNCTVVACTTIVNNAHGGGVRSVALFGSRIEKCAATNGTAGGGGAFGSYVYDSEIVGCLAAAGGGGGAYYAGIYDSTISSNSTSGNGGGFLAGGTGGSWAYGSCRFEGNSAAGYGGGGGGQYNGAAGSNSYVRNVAQNGPGGGLHLFSGVATNCLFVSNSCSGASGDGGGLNGEVAAGAVGCGFVGNSASRQGGGISHSAGAYNCWFYGNSATNAAGVGGAASVTPLYGCVLASNSAPSYPAASAARATVNCTIVGHTNAAPLVQYTNKYAFANNVVWGNVSNEIYNTTNAYNNWTNDPVFLGDPLYPWKLAPSSPCVDAGDGTPVPALLALDFYGRTRTQGAAIDIGASEYTSTNDFLPASSGRTKARLASLLFGWRSP